MRTNRWIGGVFCAVALVISGCGDSGGDNQRSGGDDTVDPPAVLEPEEDATTDEEPSDDGAGAAGETDSGLAIPLPADGGAVQLSTETDRIVNYDGDRLDEFVGFYDAWTATQSEAYVREELTGTVVSWEVQAEALNDRRGVFVAYDGTKTIVTVIVGPGS